MLIGFCMLLFVCRWVALPHHGGPCGALHRCSQLLEWGDDGACCERNHRSLAAIHPRPAGRAGQRSLLVYAQTPTSLSKVLMPLIDDNLFWHYFYFSNLYAIILLPLDVYGTGGGLPYIDGPSALCLHQGSVCNGHGERYVSDVLSLYSHKFSFKSMCMFRSG